MDISRNLACVNNLKQFGLGAQQYINDCNGYLMQHVGWGDGQPVDCWYLRLGGINSGS